MCLADVGRVRSVDGVAGTAQVDLDGRVRTVSLAPLVLDGARVERGDWVVVHTGLAVEFIDESEVAELMSVRSEMFEAAIADTEGTRSHER